MAAKYGKMYFMPGEVTYDWVKKDAIEEAPVWCSVDLRDGNQALVEPMSLEEKLEFFRTLVKIGFKQIEVGFPAASDTEYQFLRTLIENGMIPEDVTIQVLTQAREHIIRRTFEALEGAPHAIVHLYNSTSVAQREQVFGKSKEEVKELAVEGARLLAQLAEETEGNFTFEYSPESFPGTEVEYALEVCNAVLDVWKPTADKKVIINIPTTVQIAMPHVFACQVEYFHKHLKYREHVLLSVHPHNDRGCGISDAELGVLAGADRVEGTLFGNGERTGNVDLVTVAMNMYCHGVDPGLDFHNLGEIRSQYERLTGMRVGERTPYSGDLVFTAFSGSHQDAISKGMAWNREGKSGGRWDVPYLPIDPADVGREYESDVIRINSQSGKGGVAFVLRQSFGIQIPDEMRSEVGYLMKGISDIGHKELSPQEMYDIFREEYIRHTPVFTIKSCHFVQREGQDDVRYEAAGGKEMAFDEGRDAGIEAEVTFQKGDEITTVTAVGNGRLNAVNNALKAHFDLSYQLAVYEEHAIARGSDSKAVSYVGIQDGKDTFWGVGVHEDIIKSSIRALVVAVNKHLEKGQKQTV